MHDVTILDTMELTERFEASLQHYICNEDRLEFYRQLFVLLDQPNGLDGCAVKLLNGVNILDYESFVFANHLKLDFTTLNKIVYDILVQVQLMLKHRNFYVNGSLMYFPFSMNGMDLCVRRYNS
jgi:hypothetical protein